MTILFDQQDLDDCLCLASSSLDKTLKNPIMFQSTVNISVDQNMGFS